MSDLLEQLPPREGEIVALARELAARDQAEVYLVGGPVRDLLLGRPLADLDFCLENGAENFARQFAEQAGGTLRHFPQFLTFKIEVEGIPPVDVTTTRKETYSRPGALPVVWPAGLEEDLFRRDFTVNAMALELRSVELIDHFGGHEDLRREQIRILHEFSFDDDPTRIDRAIRLAVRLGFSVEQHTRELLRDALRRDGMSTVSRERLWREFFLALAEEARPRVLSEFWREGLLTPLIGRTDVSADLPERLSALHQEIAGSDADPAVAFLALLHGSSEPVAARLSGSGLTQKQIDSLRATVSDLPRLVEKLRHAENGRELLRSGASASPELLALAAAVDPSTRPSVERCRSYRSMDPGVRGNDLGVPPGPHIGRALDATRQALFLGEITRDQALAFARRTALEYLQSRSE